MSVEDNINLCTRCESYLSNRKQNVSETQSSSSCSICLGFASESFSSKLIEALRKAIEPYGGASVNSFSRQLDPPNIILPGDLVYRYHAVSKAKKKVYLSPKPRSIFAQQMKQYSKNVLNQCLDQLDQRKSLDGYPPCVVQEEEGHLSVHVVVIPRQNFPRPVHMLPSQSKQRTGRKRKLLDDCSQGGDPRKNLELRLNKEGFTLWTFNQAVDSNLILDDEIDAEMLHHSIDSDALEMYVTVWRRPFYLRGKYTKMRRDVSQTPFYVVEEGNRQKLGVTSVEEEILPVVSRYSGGISTINNDPTTDKLRFGMAKFHASGREDMDVRMLLPEPSASDQGSQIAGGRPFVCEVIDALRLPSPDDLEKMVHEINHIDADSTAVARSYGKNEMGVGIAPDFEFVPSKSFKTLQAETENKVKYYGCLCWSEEKLKDQEELTRRLGSFPLEIHQKTPIRVLHRRSNMARVRNILSGRAQRIDDHYFRLHISTDAGTYVKEFVHGDLGRTIPSVSSLLGCKTDILELDCEGIQVS